MSNKKPKSCVQEDALKITLRLNGSFITGLSVHFLISGRIAPKWMLMLFACHTMMNPKE